MPLRSGPDGYGTVTKFLHWLVFAALVAQFAVGYAMDVDDGCDPPGRSAAAATPPTPKRSGSTGSRTPASSGPTASTSPPARSTSPRCTCFFGLSILRLALVRLAWRRYDGLPPWSEHLSEGERRLVHWTERALLALLFLVPLSGLVLIGTGDDGWLPLHIGAHLAFFVALAAHLVTNLRPKILRRML